MDRPGSGTVLRPSKFRQGRIAGRDGRDGRDSPRDLFESRAGTQRQQRRLHRPRRLRGPAARCRMQDARGKLQGGLKTQLEVPQTSVPLLREILDQMQLAAQGMKLNRTLSHAHFFQRAQFHNAPFSVLPESSDASQAVQLGGLTSIASSGAIAKIDPGRTSPCVSGNCPIAQLLNCPIAQVVSPVLLHKDCRLPDMVCLRSCGLSDVRSGGT